MAETTTTAEVRLTAKQRKMLVLLAKTDARFDTNALRYHLGREEHSMQAVHMTAASLVRHGLARRHKIAGHVAYAATEVGRQWVEDHERVWVIKCRDYTTEPLTLATARARLADMAKRTDTMVCREDHEIIRTSDAPPATSVMAAHDSAEE